MLFGRRDKKKSNDRVLDLKARVDKLRQVDQASREPQQTYTLDHFLEGDDVLTGRETKDDYQPAPPAPAKTPEAPESPEESTAAAPEQPNYGFEVDLEAELQKYIKRQEEQAQQDTESAQDDAPSPPRSESSSLLLDGTWSRDDDVRPPPPRQPSAWPEQAPAPDLSWPELSTENWAGDSKDWPPEEEWPPHEEAL